MTISVKLFAILRERAGTPEVTLKLQDGTTAAAAAEMLFDRFPDLRQPARSAAFSVNRSYAAPDVVLQDGDELALIPPVSGG